MTTPKVIGYNLGHIDNKTYNQIRMHNDLPQ